MKKGRRTRDEKIRYPLLAVPSLVADLVADHSNPCSTPNPQSPIEHKVRLRNPLFTLISVWDIEIHKSVANYHKVHISWFQSTAYPSIYDWHEQIALSSPELQIIEPVLICTSWDSSSPPNDDTHLAGDFKEPYHHCDRQSSHIGLKLPSSKYTPRTQNAASNLQTPSQIHARELRSRSFLFQVC